MKKFSNATLAAVSHPRAMARIVLAFVAALLVVLIGVMGTAAGPNGALALAQESPPPEEPTGPAIQLINPSETPDVTARPDDTNPAVSDRDDGANQTYHIVAVSRDAPADAIVEAYITPITALGVELPEQTIGLMNRLPESRDTWELYWDIPTDIPDGNARITVRMYQGGTLGQIAEDAVDVRMKHNANAPTVEITWPTNGGQLGFYKPRGGAWRTVISATRSGGAQTTYFFYTVSPAGTQPQWKQCAAPTGTGPVNVECTLLEKDLPSQVTAVYAITASCNGCVAATRALESGDAHRVHPYLQRPDQMRVELSPAATENANGSYRQVVGNSGNPSEPHNCIAILATVLDHLDRPVQGANLDAHATGPSDQLQFGDEDYSAGGLLGDASSSYKVPDKGAHSVEPGENCDRARDGDDPDFSHTAQPQEGQQGDHNVPAADDIKHRESVLGSGKDDGSASFGQWLFNIFSPVTGTTDVTVWIDEEPVASETVTRPADTDTMEAGEASATARLQWLPSAITVQFDPPGDTATVGTCNKYTVKVRGGTVPVRGINVDVHATGPTNDLDFCDPGDGTPRRAPDNVGAEEDHEAEDEGEAHHRGEPPVAQHTEGETDEAGNFVIGITSPATGDTTLQAWVDGEKGVDNDTADSGEPTGRATKSWVSSIAEAQVSFVNPSAYGGSGTNVSNKPDADNRYHIVTRVDALDISGVELYISSDGTTFSKIGDATRVLLSDTWEFSWDVNVPDDQYTLRAQITGTDRREDITITVNNEDMTGDDPRDAAFETLEIALPTNAQSVAFINRETAIEGVVSDGTEGVDLFYTKIAAKDTPASADWISCGFAEPAADRSFSGTCRLQGSDQASTVTGVAAITFDCLDEGCDPRPADNSSVPPRPREPGNRDSGDAHRVFGYDGRPVVSMEPAETSARSGSCQRIVMTVNDETGQALNGENVDLHLSGPTAEARFCTPDSGGSTYRAPDQGGHGNEAGSGDGVHTTDQPPTRHIEGETNSSGKFVFGVTSPSRGDSQVTGWVDQNDNDAQDDEPSDSSVVHWGSGGGGNNNPRGCTEFGTSGPDQITGTPGDDIICAGGGKDTIRGRGGNDIIYGEGGHDSIRGNAGNDRLLGGGGIDVLRGGGGRDVIKGGARNDTMRGYDGNDRMIGNGGNDVIVAGAGRDYLAGNRGRDTLNGGRGSDRCRGGKGRDSISRCER